MNVATPPEGWEVCFTNRQASSLAADIDDLERYANEAYILCTENDAGWPKG